MQRIELSRLKDEAGAYKFEVALDDFKYKVSLSADYYQKLTGGKTTPDELIRRSFEFLLEREGPESILREFDLSIISVYFPEYEEGMKNI